MSDQRTLPHMSHLRHPPTPGDEIVSTYDPLDHPRDGIGRWEEKDKASLYDELGAEPDDAPHPPAADTPLLEFEDERAGHEGTSLKVASNGDGTYQVLDEYDGPIGDPFTLAAGPFDVETVTQAAYTAIQAPPGSFDNPTWRPQGVQYTDDGSTLYSGYEGDLREPRRDITDVAKAVRSDLKDATAGGYLPEGLTYSVTTDRFANGQALRVAVSGMPLEQMYAADTAHHGLGWSAHAGEVQRRVESVLSQYNRDTTNSQVDWFHNDFYQHADLRDETSTRRDSVEKARHAVDRARASFIDAGSDPNSKEAAAYGAAFQGYHAAIRDLQVVDCGFRVGACLRPVDSVGAGLDLLLCVGTGGLDD